MNSSDIHHISSIQELLDSVQQSGMKNVWVIDELLPKIYQGYFEAFDPITCPGDEKHKNLKSCTLIWDGFIAREVDLKTRIIIVGGGSMTDMGAFAASVYKRGISFSLVPTTLLSMVDAAVGGKTGIDYQNLKNYIGSFTAAESVYVCYEFLNTLSETDLKAGKAEILKHLILSHSNEELILNQAIELFENNDIKCLVQKSIDFKLSVVAEDPFDKSLRKQLNLGHTAAHAIESCFIEIGSPIAHGYAVAAGLWIELHISQAIYGLSNVWVSAIQNLIIREYGKLNAKVISQEKLFKKLYSDKKNRDGSICPALISAPGNAVVNVSVDERLFRKAVEAYIKA